MEIKRNVLEQALRDTQFIYLAEELVFTDWFDADRVLFAEAVRERIRSSDNDLYQDLVEASKGDEFDSTELEWSRTRNNISKKIIGTINNCLLRVAAVNMPRVARRG